MMNDPERRIQHALDMAAAEIPISADPWSEQLQLLKSVAHRPSSHRGWRWVALTVAAASLVLLTALLIIPALGGGSQTPPARPSPTVSQSPEQQFTENYLHRCLTDPKVLAYAKTDARANPTGGVVRLVRRDQYGLAAVITTTKGMMDCEVDNRGRVNNRGFAAFWPSSNLIEGLVSQEIGIHSRNDEPDAEWWRYDVSAGRMASNVARVVVVVRGHPPVPVTVGNNVYIYRSSPELDSGQMVAYDASGDVIWNSASLPLKQPIPWP